MEGGKMGAGKSSAKRWRTLLARCEPLSILFSISFDVASPHPRRTSLWELRVGGDDGEVRPWQYIRMNLSLR